MKLQMIKYKPVRISLSIASMLSATSNALAAGPPVPSEASNSLAITLIVIAAVLLLVIALLAYVLIGAAEFSLQRFKNEKTASAAIEGLTVVACCLLSTSVFAADNASVLSSVAVNNYSGLSGFSYFTLVSTIGLEVIIILAMLFQVKALLAKEKLVVAVAAVAKVAHVPLWKKWWDKMNSFKPLNEVTDTGHNYDGIHELDNKLPPWWLYGFYACIVFSFIYMYRFHVTHTAPSTLQEYEMEIAKAEVEKEEYLKHAASKVDENTVALMTDAGALAEGKKIFISTCAACHGPEGQGTVGPNLTDDYWLHKGSVKDVFKTIKYGVPEKGMKSWKDDLSPAQIAQLASYIKSIQGSKPANAKEPQGDLYKDDATASTDTTKTQPAIAAR